MSAKKSMNKSIKDLNTLSKQFSDLAKELTPQELAKAMRGGIRMEAKRIRDKARDKAMETAAAHQLKVNDTFREGIRMTVPKNLTGFEITTVPKKGKGYKTGKGGLKPLHFGLIPVLTNETLPHSKFGVAREFQNIKFSAVVK